MSEIKFDDGLKELQEIVSYLENPDTSLEDAFKYYKKAMKLSKKLREKLDEIESEIKLIQKEDNTIIDFNEE